MVGLPAVGGAGSQRSLGSGIRGPSSLYLDQLRDVEHAVVPYVQPARGVVEEFTLIGERL